MAKQGWSGMGAVQDSKAPLATCNADLDDSGPYEEIDEDEPPEVDGAEKRPALGRLPSFISLNSTHTPEDANEINQDNNKTEEFEERLI